MKFNPVLLSSVFQKFSVLLLLFLDVCSVVLAIDCSTSIKGLVNGTQSSGIIESLGFPQSYPKRSSSYTCTYELAILGDGFIKLSFEDFHLNDETVFTCKNNGTYDYLTINMHNNQDPNYYCGVGRPPTIITPKNMVTIELVVHAGSSDSFRGFKMSYTFISEEKKRELSENYLKEKTKVPAYRNDEGSFFEEIEEIAPGYASQSVDLIWYVTAPEEEDRIQLTVKEFSYPPYIAAPMLLIADGPTSESTSLQHGANVNGEPLFSTQRFMFVQLKGMVGAGTYFEVEFSFFRESNANDMCPRNYFYCQGTTHCIRQTLVCNGRNNCGQEEDEARCNTMTTVQPTCGGACFNGGVCVDGECLCPENYIGTRCEFPIGNNNPDLEHTSIMIGAFVGAVCLLSICWLVAMARKRYTETEEQSSGNRPPQRMISVHSPEELGLRRSTTVGPGDLEIPPDYSEVFIENNKPSMTTRPSIISANEPMSPPPSYDLVTGDEELGIVIECPPAEEQSNLPDVVGQNGTNGEDISPVTSNVGSENVSRQTSRSTDV